MKKNIVIVGAGITGLSAGLQLLRGGLEVTLIDRVDIGSEKQTSYGNAGLLAASSIIPLSSPGLVKNLPFYLFSKSSPLFLKYSYLPKLLPWLIPFLKNSQKHNFTNIIKNLHQLTYDTVEQHVALTKNTKASKFINKGKISMIFKDQSEILKSKSDFEIRKKYGFNFKNLSDYEFTNQYNFLSNNYNSAVEFYDHGWISSPQKYLEALKKEFISLGGIFKKAEVTSISNNQVILKDSNIISADKILICSGVWSKKLLKNIKHKVNIEAERGFHIVLKKVSFLPPNPLMIIDKKIAITPMEDTLRFAGIVDFSGVDAPANNSRYDYIRSLIKNIMPTLSWKEEDLWMGQRPSTSDSLPVVGRSKSMKNIYFAFGGQHVGLTIGPKLGKIASDLILSKKTNINLEPYSQHRFNN